MSIRAIAAAGLLAAVAGCSGESQREVRLLAPVGIVEDAEATRFERDTGCRVDLRVYDENEDLDALARRRDADAIAGPVRPGGTPDDSVALAKVTLRGGVVVTIPRELAAALHPVSVVPAGRRETAWRLRADGDNDECGRRWLAYATSQ